MKEMRVEISCPKCGYNRYRVRKFSTGQELITTISKCDDGSCDLDIENEEPIHEQDFDDLKAFFEKSFEIIECIETDCVE
jgi:hypothetical protein